MGSLILHILQNENEKFSPFAYDFHNIYKWYCALLKHTLHIRVREERGVACSIYLHFLTKIYMYSPQTHDIHYITCSTESNDMLDVTYPYLLFCHFSPVDNIKTIPIRYIFLVTRYVLACVLSMYFHPVSRITHYLPRIP